MDKRTLLAVVLSVIVITVGFVVQNALFPPAPMTAGTESSIPAEGAAQQSANGTSAAGAPAAAERPAGGSIVSVEEEAELARENVTVETPLFLAAFSNEGGVLTSLKLKQHRQGDEFVEMINTGTSEARAFELRFGGPDAKPLEDLFRYRKISDYSVEFSRAYAVADPESGESVPFTVRKRYTFKPDDYLIELAVTIENSVNRIPMIVTGDYAYTLGFGPQIGPSFENLDGRYDYRKFFVYRDGKRENLNVQKDGRRIIDSRITWAAIAGKYFTVIGIPDATLYTTTLSAEPIPGLSQTAHIFFSRPPLRSSVSTDVFKFYMGPKLSSTLGLYNDAGKNGFGLQNLNLDEVIETSALLGWLEWILKYILIGFYRIIPNYGVAIILLTILVKVLFFPMTRKSMHATAKMQTLAPKIEELKKKYSNNPTKLNQEMTELYKREGANPLGGCLPMLLQIPIFFALYNLLNSHFDLRGSVFIPGWIYDLSSPESILHLPFTIPIVNWTELRLLPFIYVGTQLLTSKFTSTPDTSANNSMKMMMYFMPIMFFFILYNVPSGLLLYWIVSNVLQAAQQLYMNKHLRKVRKPDGGSPVRK